MAQSTNLDTGVSVSIDSISYRGWNNNITNCTVSEENVPHPPISIPGQISVSQNYKDSVQGPTYLSVGFDNRSDFDRSDSGPKHYWLFQDYNQTGASSSPLNSNYIEAGFTSDSHYKSASSSPEEYQEFLGNQATKGFFWETSSGSSADQRGLQVQDVADAGFGFSFDRGETYLDNFSQKGVALLDFRFDSLFTGSFPKEFGGNKAEPTKRENIFAAARVTAIVSAGKGEITVDNPNIFNLPEDTIYSLFRCGRTFRSSDPDETSAPLKGNEHFGLFKKVKQEGNLITLGSAGKVEGGEPSEPHLSNIRCPRRGQYNEMDHTYFNLLGPNVSPNGSDGEKDGAGRFKNLKELWISPYKYWIIMQIFPRDSDGAPVVDRAYSSLSLINAGKTQPKSADYGPTYLESLFTDGAYSNAWSLSPGTSNSLETDTDYGFGKYDAEDNPLGGYVNKFHINKSDQWQSIDLTPIVDVDKISPGDNLTISIQPFSPSSTDTLTLGTFDNDDIMTESEGTFGDKADKGTKRPFLLSIFEDELPILDSFTVAPYEENPMFPYFRWTMTAEDAWYGLIIVDDDLPYHQYHEGVHFPLSIPKKSNEHPLVIPGGSGSQIETIGEINNYYRKDFDNNWFGIGRFRTVNDIESFIVPEGLAGWAFKFNGTSDYLTTNAILNTGWTTAKNMTWRAHIIPSAESTATTQPIFDGGNVDDNKQFRVWMDTDGKINVDCGINVTPAVQTTLQSVSTIVKDGETPTCIIVTLDATLKFGNLKLFINGKLEDQSGKADDTGSANVWKKDEPMRALGGSTDSRSGYNMINAMLVGTNLNQTIAGTTDTYYYFNGIIEEMSLYPITLYPVLPSDLQFVLEKPISELNTSSKGGSKSSVARLFLFDYHNIRGTTNSEVAMSSPVSWRKAAPLLDGGTV